MSHYAGTSDWDDRLRQHTFECDHPECTAEYVSTGGFQEVWYQAKVLGWVAMKDEAGNWCHYCPNCKPLRYP